jgi:hypothetical protein
MQSGHIWFIHGANIGENRNNTENAFFIGDACNMLPITRTMDSSFASLEKWANLFANQLANPLPEIEPGHRIKWPKPEAICEMDLAAV